MFAYVHVITKMSCRSKADSSKYTLYVCMYHKESFLDTFYVVVQILTYLFLKL